MSPTPAGAENTLHRAGPAPTPYNATSTLSDSLPYLFGAIVKNSLLLDLCLLIFSVNQRYQSSDLPWGFGALTVALFAIGIFNEDNAIGLPVALIFFPIWLFMGQ